MRAVVFAAGKGTRLRPLTDKKPKALVELKGRPLIERVLDSAKAAGIDSAVLIVGHLKEMIQSRLRNNYMGIRLEYVVQEQQLGTAHALLHAKEAIGAVERFMLLSTDVIAGKKDLRALAEKTGFECVILARKEKNPEKFGVLEISGDRVLGTEEKPARPKSSIVNAGVYVFSPRILGEVEKVKLSRRGEFELTEAVNALAKKNLVGFVEAEEKVFDIGSIGDLKKAEQLI